MSWQFKVGIKKPNAVLGCINGSTALRSREVMALLDSAGVRPHGNIVPSSGLHSLRRIMTNWSRSNGRKNKAVTRLETTSYKDKWKELGSFSLEKRWFREEGITIHRYMRGCHVDSKHTNPFQLLWCIWDTKTCHVGTLIFLTQACSKKGKKDNPGRNQD